MEIIAESNDPVRLSFLMVFLRDAGFDPALYDSNMASTLGTAGVVRQRIAVPPEQSLKARRALKEAGLE
jgi:Putative prokaryotic signal transducing protein